MNHANAIAVSSVAEPHRCDTALLRIAAQPDVLAARQTGREFAMRIGFTGSDVTVIAAAICEIARNIVDYAQQGEMSLSIIDDKNDHKGILVVARDQGPGIPDLNQALRYGCSTRKGLGIGLPGAKWLMDEFHIQSQPGSGTTVHMIKWLPNGLTK